MGSWRDYIEPGDLTGHVAEVAGALGIETAVRLCEAFPGAGLYIQQPDSMLTPAKRRYIRAHPDIDPRVLARETGYSVSQVYRILSSPPEDDRQQPLF
jgi:hypothetical protein